MIVTWRLLTCNILGVRAFKEISAILEGEFVLVLGNDNARATFVHLVSYRVVESFKDAFGIVLPYLCRNQRVLWVNLEAVVPDSVEQFTCCANKWDGVDVSKRLSVLKNTSTQSEPYG